MRRRDANNRAMTDTESARPANEAPPKGGRWLAPSDDFFRPMLALAELAPVDDSCADERRLHERLVAAPMMAVDAGELAAIADADARENYVVFLAFRDALVAAGSLEAYYLRLARAVPTAVRARSNGAPRSCCIGRSESRSATDTSCAPIGMPPIAPARHRPDSTSSAS
jgi:hypothetical protein